MYDTHAHLDLLAQKLEIEDGLKELDLENVTDQDLTKIKSSTGAVLEYINDHNFLIQATVSTNNFLLNQKLFGDVSKIKFLIGSHPEMVTNEFDVESYLDDQKKALKNVDFSNVVGIGECGLDYFYSKDQQIHDKQKKLFISQIELAISLNLPLIIHCRDSFEDLFEILESYPKIHGRFLIHCFTGGINESKKVLEMGGKMAFGGVCTYKSAVNVREALQESPIENVFLETDLPFLSPTPKRGEVCLPEYINHTADLVSQVKNMSTQDLWEKTEKQVREFFNI